MILRIVNDVAVDIQYYILANGKQYCKTILCNEEQDFHFSCSTESILIVKNDIWDTKNTLESAMLKLYCLDLSFGNLAKSVNLPFCIHYEINPSSYDLDVITIKLSNLVYTTEHSINSWKKGSFFQILYVSLLIESIGIILSFIFNLWVKIIFLLCVSLFAVFVFSRLIKKRNWIYHILKTYQHHNN